LRTEQDERGGGILADEMGMGKSLSILSLIVHTLEDAKEWQKQPRREDVILKPRSAATLVIVPSELLINGWDNEVLW
jgi:SWI/SNF-related matrix-associated actin-dependent regulator of chromatin subfamily A3